MALAKLTIMPLKANLREVNKEAIVQVMYNPKEFTIDSSTQFQRSAMPGLQTPITQFVSGQTQTLSLDLFFDTYEDKTDVRLHTAQVTNLLKIDSDIHAPPVCRFEWGVPLSLEKGVFFQGVFDKVTQKFTMFLDSGMPVRATLSVSISEYRSIEEQTVRIKFQSSDRTKVRVLKQGDQLWYIAEQEYGDPAQWRLIADANNIGNPRLLPTGTEVILPPLE
jgi:nucleoid-associated protein YgaU